MNKNKKSPYLTRFLKTSIALAILHCASAHAASVALDNAGNYTGFNPGSFPSGITPSTNGGTGFTAWSQLNGTDLFGVGVVSSPSNSSAFGFYGFANGIADRGFTGNLVAGDTFTFQIQIGGTIGAFNPGSGLGFTLGNSSTYNPGSNTNPFTARYDFGTNTLLANGTTVTGIAGAQFTNGVQFSFTLTSATDWSLTTSTLSGTPVSTTVTGSGLDALGSFRVFTNVIGSNNVGFNNLSVTSVPEPSTYAMLAGGCFILFVMKRNKRGVN